MINVLQGVVRFSGIGGAISYIYNTSAILKQRYAINVDVASLSIDKREYPFGVKKILLIRHFRGYLKRYLFSKYIELFLSKKYDIVNGHGDLLNQDVITLHNIVAKAYELLNKRPDGLVNFQNKMLSNGRFKRIIVNSMLMRNELVDRFKIPLDKIRVIYPSYNPSILTTMIDKKRAKEMLGVDKEDFCFILPVSGDFAKRGVKNLIDIFSLIYRERKNVICLISGKDKNTPYYLDYIREKKLDGRIKIINQLDISILLSAGDMVIYPALIEEFGISLMEAMISKIVVLTTKDVGVVEIMDEELKKFCICSNRDEFVRKAIYVMDNGFNRDILIRNSIKLSSYTWDMATEKIYRVYKEIIGDI